jgi:adenosylcobyric acid synthase
MEEGCVMRKATPRLFVVDMCSECDGVGAFLRNLVDEVRDWGLRIRVITLRPFAEAVASALKERAGSTVIDVVEPGADATAILSDTAAFALAARTFDLSLVIGSKTPGAEGMTSLDVAARVDAAAPVVKALSLPAIVIGDAPSVVRRAVQRLQSAAPTAAAILVSPSRTPSGDRGEPADAVLTNFVDGPGDPGRAAEAANASLGKRVDGLDVDRLMRIAASAPDVTPAPPSAPPSARRAGNRERLARPAKGRVLMVQGTSSNAGKSFLTAALARYFANRGISVAPFKGQNMSNNARVVEGGEIGVAQYIQALAARTAPDVRMNPVLLKPEAVGSQVILMGRPDYELSAMPFRLRKPLCWPYVASALSQLRSQYDLVIAEGAGSAFETYLRGNDIVNMRVARESGASVLLVADAARGGAFTHLYGTWVLMSEAERALVRGFVLNLFFSNGDPVMLLPGCEQLASLTNDTPVLGILPEIESGIPDEDRYGLSAMPVGRGYRVAIVACPMISNFDEFQPLRAVKNVEVMWSEHAEDLASADLVILPGSKHVAADLRFMKERGLDAAVVAHVKRGKKVLGICGGMQMLGCDLNDPEGIEEAATGLGILPIKTVYRREKIQRRVTHRFAEFQGPWSQLSGVSAAGYEIRQGRSERYEQGESLLPVRELIEVLPAGAGFVAGNVMGVYLHGLFESEGIIERFFGEDVNAAAALEAAFERMSSLIETHLDVRALETIALG